LIDHNGEHLPRSVVDAIVDAAEGLDSAWWAGGDDPDASSSPMPPPTGSTSSPTGSTTSRATPWAAAP